MRSAHRFNRRWLLVGAGALGLVGAGFARAELPVHPAPASADELRARIMAGGAQPYVGYARSTGRLALPELEPLGSTVALFTGTTRIRAFVQGPQRWRVDELTPAGERGTYRLDGREFVWDFGLGRLTEIVGATPVRLPRAADLLPPELACRLLALAPADPVRPLAARRIAGRTAVGLRLVPADPQTTVGRVDIWADEPTALPLRVEVAARDADPARVPLLRTELLDVDTRPPEPAALRPGVPPGTGLLRVDAADVSGVLRVLDAPPPPPRLAGRDRVALSGTAANDLPGIGRYGSDLAGFALVPLSPRIADQALDGAGAAGGTAVDVARGRAVLLAGPLLSVGIARRRDRGVLLVGTVVPAVLEQALRDLTAEAS